MCPFSSGASAGPSAGAAMLPYCLAPAATAPMLPAEAAAGSSTLARSSSVIFSVGLSSVLAIISFFTTLFYRDFLLLRLGLTLATWTCAAGWPQNSRMLLIKLPECFYQLPVFFGLIKHRRPAPIQKHKTQHESKQHD